MVACQLKWSSPTGPAEQFAGGSFGSASAPWRAATCYCRCWAPLISLPSTRGVMTRNAESNACSGCLQILSIPPVHQEMDNCDYDDRDDDGADWGQSVRKWNGVAFSDGWVDDSRRFCASTLPCCPKPKPPTHRGMRCGYARCKHAFMLCMHAPTCVGSCVPVLVYISSNAKLIFAPRRRPRMLQLHSAHQLIREL